MAGTQQVITGAGPSTITGGAARFTGVTYTQSSIYIDNNAATETYMNNDGADGSSNNSETGTNNEANPWIKANLGSTKFIDYVIVGYDYLNNLAGGWGVSYTEGNELQISTDDTNWTTVAKTPTYSATGMSNGLVRIPIKKDAQYIRMRRVSTNWMALLEFSIWGF